MKIRFFIALAAVLTAFGFGISSNFQTAVESAGRAGFAARCATAPFERAFAQSKAVFVGEAVSDEKSGDVRTFEFQVERFWKGNVGKRVAIEVYETPRFQLNFEKGEKYLIYAPEIDGKLRVSRCSRSSRVDSAEEDLQKLGKGKVPR